MPAGALETKSPVALTPCTTPESPPQDFSRPGDAAHWFDDIYSTAGRDQSRVPWAHKKANPALVAWLNAEAPSLVRPGARAVVVGCGLANDVQALMDRGYDAVGFDCSEEAVRWARELRPDLADRLSVDCAIEPSSKLVGRLVAATRSWYSRHWGARIRRCTLCSGTLNSK